jgi:hypothetical protein
VVEVPPAFAPEILDGPRVSMPGRDYILFAGPLAAAGELGWRCGELLNAAYPERESDPNEFEPQSPSLFWPGDRAWCEATEIDLDSTYVGGSPQLIEALLNDPRFEAWPAQLEAFERPGRRPRQKPPPIRCALAHLRESRCRPGSARAEGGPAMQLAVVLDQSGEEAPQLAALTGREGLEQGILGILDAGVEPLQGLSAGGRQPNQVAATISLVAGARDEAVTLEVVDDRDHVAAVDRQSAPERRLAGWPLIVERDEHREVVPADSGRREALADQPVRVKRRLVQQPARELGQPPRRARLGFVGRMHRLSA